VPGDDELGAGQRDRVRALRVILGNQIQCSGYARASQVAQVLGLLAELFQAGVVGQGNGWREPTSFSSPAVRIVRPKGGW